jgi:hypothetical protein
VGESLGGSLAGDNGEAEAEGQPPLPAFPRLLKPRKLFEKAFENASLNGLGVLARI